MKITRSSAAEFFGELADVEPIHLELQGTERNAEIARRRSHVPSRFFKRAQDEVALEGVGRLLEEAFAAARHLVELGKMELERQILVGDPLFVAHRDQPLNQVLELADVPGPPVA